MKIYQLLCYEQFLLPGSENMGLVNTPAKLYDENILGCESEDWILPIYENGH